MISLAILEMSKISVFGLHSNRKAILEELHKKEAIEICKPDTEGVDFKETAKSITQFDKFMQSAESALAVLDEYAHVKTGFFTNGRILPVKKYHMASSDSDTILHAIYQIIGFSEKIRERTENIQQITAKQAALEPYLALDIPMNVMKTGSTLMKTGTLNGSWTAERLQSKLDVSGLSSVHYEILYSTREYTYLWIVFPKSQEQKTNELLQNIGFTEPAFSLSHHTPQKKTEVLEEAKAALKDEVQEYISRIKEQIKRRYDIELFHDHLALRKDKYKVLSKIGMMEHIFLIEGYIPKKHSEDVKQLVESRWTAYVELAEPENSEDVPIAFQNSVFAAPVEEITETYSMPSSTDVDPNPVMAFFYYLFFGMMFSDA